jgi:hypothetical protein
MKKFLLIFHLLFILAATGIAQKSPIKFGDVSISDIEMTTYLPDTSAPAVILCDFGHFDSQTVKFTRTLRIKILKKDGYSWANYAFPGTQNSQARGITFNLENGKVVQTKLKNESIFTDRVSGNKYNIRVAMPNVKVGSVLDMEFTMNMIPTRWKFQDLIPVAYSELIMDWSQYITLGSHYYGFEKLDFSSPTRWVAKQMPAFKVEPFLNSQENYLSRIEFNVIKFFDHDYASTWELISTTLLKSSDFGEALSGSGFLNNLSNNISESNQPKELMIRMACDSVKKMIKWNENESLFPKNASLNARLKMKVGNSADINLILIQLLKKLDFETTPVVLSTRSNGILSPVMPSIEKLNYVIAMVKIGDTRYLLDATDPYLPFDMLPLRCLNYEGRTIDEHKSELINLNTGGKNKTLTVYDLSIDDNQNFKGKIAIQHVDYSASDFRRTYNSFNSSEEYLQSFKKDKPGLFISNAEIINLDSIYLPVNESFDVTINNQATLAGNEIYLQPLLYEQLKENPFKMEDRKYPIDYGFKYENTTIINYSVPDNYGIISMPSPISLKMEGNAATFQYEISQGGSQIKVTSKFTIMQTLFLPQNYKALKEFYNQMILKQAEPIIIKKS